MASTNLVHLAGWVGAITGPGGAVWLALNLPSSGFGYPLFLLSSATMALYGYTEGDNKVLAQNLLFTAINIVGVWRWLL